MDKGIDELKQKERRRWISFAAVAVLLVVVFFLLPDGRIFKIRCGTNFARPILLL